MKLVWTRSSLPVSKFIRWGLKEETSHFAIVFDNSVVFHSNFVGTNLQWYPHWKKSLDVVYEIDIPLRLSNEEAVWQKILGRYSGKKYDFRAFAYFAWRGILKRLFKIPFPATNPWEDKNAYLCTGLVKALKDASDKLPSWLSKALESIQDGDMTSPDQLHQLIEQARK